MREKEIKILWGRSGNRCAICKLELTPDGDRETLGEMAHVVAKSKDGPRGKSELDSTERDTYKNLILLCPTHHTNIDKNYQDWSVERLLKIKTDHEAWVSEQLNTGNINISKIDNAKFLESRQFAWQELSRNHVTIAISLTPLRISSDNINAMDANIQESLNEARLRITMPAERVNAYDTRPTESGILNEKFPQLPERKGHSFQIFNSGHCEYFRELGYDIDRITEVSRERNADTNGATYVIHYIHIAEIIDAGINWLNLLWDNVLPFEYMDFRVTILNSKGTTLFSYEDDWGGSVFGHPTRSGKLEYSDVVTKGDDFELLSLQVLQWLSNCYGLVLEKKHDDNGKYIRPDTIR